MLFPQAEDSGTAVDVEMPSLGMSISTMDIDGLPASPFVKPWQVPSSSVSAPLSALCSWEPRLVNYVQPFRRSRNACKRIQSY